MKYYVTVEATIRKTYKIEADDQGEARNAALERFSVLEEDDTPEYYKQRVIEIEELGSFYQSGKVLAVWYDSNDSNRTT